MNDFDGPERVAEAYRPGVCRVLNKPFDIVEVPSIMAAVAAASRRREVTRMARLAINASPFRCRWILAGAEMRLEQWNYAIWLRSRHHGRVVSEQECSRCACWKPPTSDAEPGSDIAIAAGALDSPRARLD